jgi:hypothetical protein
MICGYLFEWKWTGLRKQTLWDWLKLLIIPAVLAVGGFLLTRSENRATQAAAERRVQDEALQAYLDQMSAMLIPNGDQPSLYKAYRGDSLSSVARARTLTVLPRLDADRKARVVQFLYESGLITKDRVIVDLRGANLMGANLSRANLSRANLSRTDLSWAYLEYAKLNGANVTDEQLAQCRSLKGAAMPDGQILKEPESPHTPTFEQLIRQEGHESPNAPTFEDWLESKGSGEDGENE